MTSITSAARTTRRWENTVALRRWSLALPAACLSAVLGIYQLGSPSLWVDEGFTFRAVGDDYVRLTEYAHGFYYAFEKTWTTLAGTSEVALRAPSVLGAVLAVVVLFGYARELLGERVALVSSILLAVNPFVVMWSQQARGYTFFLTLAIASTWLLQRTLERDESRLLWVRYGVALTMTIVWQWFAALLLIPIHVLVGWRYRSAWVAWALAVLVTSPWIAQFLARGEKGSPTEFLHKPGFEDLAGTSITVSGAFGIGLALAVVGAVLVQPDRRRLLIAWAALPIALAFAISMYKPVFIDRYFLISCPAFAILGAVALVELRGRARVAAATAIAVGTMVGLVLWYGPDGSRNWKGEDWKAAAALVMRDGGALLDPTWTWPVYRYYGGRIAETGWVLEREEYVEDFVTNPHVRERFGERLRAVHP